MKKKIAIITSEFPPLPGGIGNHAYNLAKYLHDANNEIAVVTNFRNSIEDVAFDKRQEFQVYRIRRNLFTKVNRVKKALLVAKKYDTIIYSGKFSLWTGGILKVFFAGKKHIAVLHGSEIRAGGTMSKALMQWSLKRFDTLIAVSNFTRDVALSCNPHLKIDVINNGFVIPNRASQQSFTKMSGSPRLITVGNVTQRKGQHNVIEALPKLINIYPEVHYHCVGIPTDRELLSKLAESLKVVNNVTFHGALSSEDLTSVLCQCDVFVMLSDVLGNGDFEGFGIAILEANALGIPAVGSNNSGISDAIQSGFSGELVQPKNTDEIANAFLKIMTNYEHYAANATLWSKNFEWEKIGKQYVTLIER